MKITTLTENTSLSPEYQAEHGLSLLIENGPEKILFDMGQTDTFLKNAGKMGISLGDVAFAVLSHGHYDHGGGMQHFFQANSHAPVYVSQYAFRDYYNAEQKYIGLDPELKSNNRIVLTGGIHPISSACTLFSCNDFYRPYPTAPHGLTEKCGHRFYIDRFHHEQYLLLQENNRRILFTGCSHKGILNIINWFRPHVIVGGFHLMKTELDTVDGLSCLDAVAEMLTKNKTLCFSGHCTGLPQFDYLKEKLGDQLYPLSAGASFDI